MTVPVTASVILRAPFTRRAWAEPAYAVVGVPLGVVGLSYAVGAVVLGAGLAVTAAGIPLTAFAVYGARRLGGVHRGLAGRLLGEHVAPPAPPRPATGFYGRVQSLLADVPGWRAMAYLVLQPPLAVVQAYVVASTWLWGLVALTYPVQRAFGWNESTGRDASGTIRHGLAFGGVYFDTPSRQLLVSLAGVALLLLAPWAVHASTLPTRMLLRWLLGPYGPAERIRDLEETRAHVVDDAAATLRRIERDLHDGAQARLVALVMQLTMIKEAAPAAPARDLAVAAQATAKEAVTELRELVRGIHPPVLDQGLEAALASLAARSVVPAEVRVDIGRRPTAAIESIAYFCAAELLANAAKHSGASQVRIELTRDGDRLRLRVRDDGAGGATVGAGSGLPGLLDRLRAVDGRLTVDSPPGGPTVVTVELPPHA